MRRPTGGERTRLFETMLVWSVGLGRFTPWLVGLLGAGVVRRVGYVATRIRLQALNARHLRVYSISDTSKFSSCSSDKSTHITRARNSSARPWQLNSKITGIGDKHLVCRGLALVLRFDGADCGSYYSSALISVAGPNRRCMCELCRIRRFVRQNAKD
jgi:hypothetical protein